MREVETDTESETDSEGDPCRQQVQELQRMLGSLEEENCSLRDKMAAREAELKELKEQRGKEEHQQRYTSCRHGYAHRHFLKRSCTRSGWLLWQLLCSSNSIQGH